MTLCSRSEFVPVSSDAVIVRCSAVTFPLADDGTPPVPPALPTPITLSATFTVSESPKAATARPDAFTSRMTATSFVGAVPTTFAM
jgi:hypothetical protein